MKQWYETLFENYARKYDEEPYTHGTSGECDFIETEIGHNKQTRILDIGCGTGRHAIELAKRGYSVTGIDLSDAQLKRAREKAEEANVRIDFQRQDARDLPFQAEFDLAIMLCEGGFSLMETDEMNFQILESATKALKPGAKFIFTTLNGLFPLFHSMKEFYESHAGEGLASCGMNQFDLLTFRDHNITTLTDDDGNPLELQSNERYYIPPEITWLLKSLGYKDIAIKGAKHGAYNRNDELSTEDFEMLVIANL